MLATALFRPVLAVALVHQWAAKAARGKGREESTLSTSDAGMARGSSKQALVTAIQLVW